MSYLVPRPLFFRRERLLSSDYAVGWHAMPGRMLLIVGCVVSIGIAVRSGEPSAGLLADPALAHLLRGMAVIKGMVALAVIAGVSWRLRWRVSGLAAGCYIVGSSMLAGSTVLIWQLSHIPLAAILFHVALLGVLVMSWREREIPG